MGRLALDILRDLTPLNRVLCSSDYDKAIAYLCNLLPFRVLEYPAADEHNGWVIPPKWDVIEARIIKDGKTIFDGKKNALSVIALSKGFTGRIPLAELKKHLFFDTRFEDATPFHFRQQYRSWNRDWGFCVPKRFFDSLEPGEYVVDLQVDEHPGSLKILEYTHNGRFKEMIVFAAHLDHPGMANDGLSGCAIGVELFRRLSEKSTKFSYRLFLHQEIIGSEYYLSKMDDSERVDLMESIFLEMLGTNTQLALQHSRAAQSNIEFSVKQSMIDLGLRFREGPFDSIVTNGDYVWETYGIPMSSFSRYPFPEYHTDRDNFSLMSEDALEESLAVLLRAIDTIEASPVIIKKFRGNICLSNPKYNLYVDPGQAALGGWSTDEIVKKKRFLMDFIPTIKKPVSIRYLSDQAGLPQDFILDYLAKWQEKGLVSIE